MPTVVSTQIEALAFCIDGRCPGYTQQPVPAIRRVNEYSYVELGGDIPGTERSTVDVVFLDPEHDAVCTYCGKPRLVSEQERPEYENTSGRDPLEIFHRGQAAGQMRELIGGQENDRLRRELENAELKARLAEQDTRIERLAGLLEQSNARVQDLKEDPIPPRRGPGRPRKEGPVE
jgi:hypothetical protein